MAVALPRMLEKIETELATAGPAERVALRQRAERAARLPPRSEALRRDRTLTVIADPRSGGDGFTALGYGVHRAHYPAAAASVTVSQIGCWKLHAETTVAPGPWP